MFPAGFPWDFNIWQNSEIRFNNSNYIYMVYGIIVPVGTPNFLVCKNYFKYFHNHIKKDLTDFKPVSFLRPWSDQDKNAADCLMYFCIYYRLLNHHHLRNHNSYTYLGMPNEIFDVEKWLRHNQIEKKVCFFHKLHYLTCLFAYIRFELTVGWIPCPLDSPAKPAAPGLPSQVRPTRSPSYLHLMENNAGMAVASRQWSRGLSWLTFMAVALSTR